MNGRRTEAPLSRDLPTCSYGGRQQPCEPRPWSDAATGRRTRPRAQPAISVPSGVAQQRRGLVVGRSPAWQEALTHHDDICWPDIRRSSLKPPDGRGAGVARDAVLGEVPLRLWAHPAMPSALAERDLGAVLRLVREHAGWTQTMISGRTGVAQSEVSPIMAGTRKVQALARLERIADGLGMPDEARMTLGLAPSGLAGDPPGDRARCTCGSAEETGECSMHRRHFLAGVGSVVASSAAGSALDDPALLAEVVRRRASSNVNDLTLDDLELTVDHLMRQVPVQSHHELFPLAARNWAAAEQLLDGWQHVGQRRRLVGLAGHLSYYVGRLHLSAGRYPQSWQLATLTQQYAAVDRIRFGGVGLGRPYRTGDYSWVRRGVVSRTSTKRMLCPCSSGAVVRSRRWRGTSVATR
jgi:transcriptional regulator with XRE-family HTH domain